MEENTVRTNEIEVEEAPEESSGSGAFVAGIVGGFLAYAAIGGVKKLVAFAQTKWADRKQKEQTKTVIEADYTEVPDEQQEDSDEDASEEK